MSTSSDPKAGRMLTLRSSEGAKFEVPEAVVLQSSVIKRMIDVNPAISVIPLHNVTGAILVKVIEYCRMHADDRVSEKALRNWDAEFVKIDNDILQGLMAAAYYMEIKSLLYLTSVTCPTVVNIIKKMQKQVSDEPERNSQEAFQMEMHAAARMVRAADSLLKLVSDLKHATILSSFASLTNNQVERRVKKFEQLVGKSNRLMEKIGEQATAGLKELEAHYYSSIRRTEPEEYRKIVKIKKFTPKE